MPLAVAIVLSGMYEDDLDNAEDVVYTGQGGHNLLGNKRQIKDQKMERGNLALKVCSVSMHLLNYHHSNLPPIYSVLVDCKHGSTLPE